MMSLSIDSSVKLNSSSLALPLLGFGVYKAPPAETTKACLAALKQGYRHIDTAQAYSNEKEVGEAVHQSSIPRDQVFITTKVFAPAGSVEKSYQQCLTSLEKLSTSYVDLFLIHSPKSGREGREELWLALERLQKEGKAKSIGVSNYAPQHLDEMKEYATVFPPAVNQFELHPWCQQKDIVKWCKDNNVVVEAYCPVVRNLKADHPVLKGLSEKYSKSTAQVLIRWSLQSGYVPLPKSVTNERIKANAEVYDFELSAEDMKSLNDLDEGRAGHIAWTPHLNA